MIAMLEPSEPLTMTTSPARIAGSTCASSAAESSCLLYTSQSCRLIAFLMMDGARHFSIITTQRKAITAASQRLPTGYAPEENALSMTCLLYTSRCV